MTAESIKPKPKRLTKTTQKQKQILKEFTEHPQASMRQLAKYAGASVSTVHEVLQRYGITKNYVEDYKENRADIFAGLQSRLISSISEQDIQKAPMGSRVLAAAQLYDKERIERGLSNGDQPIMVIIRDKPKPVQVEGKVIDIESSANQGIELSTQAIDITSVDDKG